VQRTTLRSVLRLDLDDKKEPTDESPAIVLRGTFLEQDLRFSEFKTTEFSRYGIQLAKTFKQLDHN